MERSVALCFAALLIAACAQVTPPDPPKPDPPKPDVVSESPQLAGTKWLAEDIDGRGVADQVQSTLEFIGADRVGGRAGCNRYAGGAVISGESVRFGQLISTKMACLGAIMDQESRFLAALEASRSFRVDEEGKLVLSDEAGAARLRFSRMEPSSSEAPPRQ